MNGLQKACKAIETEFLEKEELSNKERETSHMLGYRVASELFNSEELISKEDLGLMVDITRRVCNKQKNTSQILEKELLRSIIRFIFILGGDIDSDDYEKSTRSDEEKREITEILINFAHELIGINKNRDSFSGKRKGFATRMLIRLNGISKVEGLEDVFIANFKSRSLDLLEDNLQSIQDYYGTPEMKHVEVNPKILELIEKRANKAKKGGELVGCLDTLVKLFEIDEHDALDRLSEWKQKYC